MKAGSTSNKSDLFSNEKKSQNLHIIFFLFITTSYKLLKLSSKSPCHCSPQRQTSQKQNFSRDLVLLWQKMRRKLHIKNVRTKSPLICLVNQDNTSEGELWFLDHRCPLGRWQPVGDLVGCTDVLLGEDTWTLHTKYEVTGMKHQTMREGTHWLQYHCRPTGSAGQCSGVTTVTVWPSRINILNSI